MKRNDSIIKGRTAQVDICPDDAGFVLSVGRVSIWLDRRIAEDVVATLGQALWVDEHVINGNGRRGRDGGRVGIAGVVAPVARRSQN